MVLPFDLVGEKTPGIATTYRDPAGPGSNVRFRDFARTMLCAKTRRTAHSIIENGEVRDEGRSASAPKDCPSRPCLSCFSFPWRDAGAKRPGPGASHLRRKSRAWPLWVQQATRRWVALRHSLEGREARRKSRLASSYAQAFAAHAQFLSFPHAQSLAVRCAHSP